MSSDTWKLEKDLCRCCHSEGSFKNLAQPFKPVTLEEIYADMLKDCYDIDMTPIPGMLAALTYTICEVCIIRLRDASDFKKQVLLCEERFREIYIKNGVNAPPVNIDVEIKEEVPDQESDNEDFKDDFSDDFPLDDKDEDYDIAEDLKKNEEETAEEKAVQVEVRNKRKYKKRAVKTSSVKSKRIKKKVLKEELADENDVEKKQGTDKGAMFIKDADYNQVGDLYHCARCDKKYSTINSIKAHVKSKYYTQHKCSCCIEEFGTRQLLTEHQLEVHNVDHRFSCSVCDKKFFTKRQLTSHMYRFHLLGELGRRYKCQLCDYVTVSSEKMYKHKFNHKSKDQHCSFCSKSFKRKSTLRLHEKIHTGDRRKVCNECGQAFVQKASLNYHMTKYHPGVKF